LKRKVLELEDQLEIQRDEIERYKNFAEGLAEKLKR
jgi:hypothetical protein